ncbi:serine protease snake-like [Trichoplusia ni]|uniref:Serine protease snake-like n=1 Tax=Trichoplusia ni TaxID=7111 RepID=A0A7E5WTM9_TRINI|nr:serine protease snake-like [Trichoplusia ni]
MHVYKCLSTVLDLKKKVHPRICSFRSKEPIVCCTDCEAVNDTRNVLVDNEGGVFFKSGQKARDKCIEHLTRLPYFCQTQGLERFWSEQKQCHVYEHTSTAVVYNGEDAEASRFPHMALLGYGSKASTQWLCGGSLISDRYILTAAHCMSAPDLGPVRYVAMGILKRSDPQELWHVYKVIKAITYPEYSPPSKYHDIALLKTDRKIVYSKDVFPACLNYLLDSTYSAIATGWGKLGKDQPLADNLQEVRLEEFSEHDCKTYFPPHRLLKQGYDHNMQMCYGDPESPKDTCEGDSGGPLQITSILSKCLHSVVGVTSYGRACGTTADAGMYTRVRYYLPWIEAIVWPDQ